MDICRIDCAQAMADLQESEERFRLVFDYAPIGMAIIDLAGRLTRVNPAMSTLTGYDVEELTVSSLQDIMHSEDESKLQEASEVLFARQEPRRILEIRFVRKDGSVIYTILQMALVHGAMNQPLYYIGQFIDITERKHYEDAIRHMAYHDSLTELPNRMSFRDRLTIALDQARANQQMLAVVFLDLDRFKEINDIVGHYIGDKALKIIANRISGALRKSDAVARLGGDEFTLLLPSTHNRDSVDLVMDKIIKVIEQPLVFDDQEFIISASMGVAMFPDDGLEVDTLLQVADKNMYLDKQRRGVER